MRLIRYKLLVFIFGGLSAILGGVTILYFDKCWFVSPEEKCQYIKYCWFEDNDCPVPEAKLRPNVPVADPAPVIQTGGDSVREPEPKVPSADLIPTTLTFKIKYLYRAKGTEEFQSLENDSVLYAGARYKLIFEPTKNSYVYIFRMDSDGGISRLFPDSSFFTSSNKNPVQKGFTYFVPAERGSFKLNKQPGKETIYFVATQQPDAALENLAAQKARGPEEKLTARQQWDTAMTSRGLAPEPVADETQAEPFVWKEKKQKFSVMPQYLKDMCDGCVHVVSFQHRR